MHLNPFDSSLDRRRSANAFGSAAGYGETPDSSACGFCRWKEDVPVIAAPRQNVEGVFNRANINSAGSKNGARHAAFRIDHDDLQRLLVADLHIGNPLSVTRNRG